MNKNLKKHIELQTKYSKIGENYRKNLVKENFTEDFIETLSNFEVTKKYTDILNSICSTVDTYDEYSKILFLNTIYVNPMDIEKFSKAISFGFDLPLYEKAGYCYEQDGIYSSVDKNFLNVLINGGIYVANYLSREECMLLKQHMMFGNGLLFGRYFERNPLSILCISGRHSQNELYYGNFYLQD